MIVGRGVPMFCNRILTVGKLHTSVKSVRVRFAPSPTGDLHLGGLRTALYNYAFARSKKGTFILRIEDTDRTRIVPGAISKIQGDLEWLGLIPDEGPNVGGAYGPYIQSERGELYLQEVQKLIKKGAAYHCFCSEKRLELLRKEAIRKQSIPKYDNRCRNLNQKEVNAKLSAGAKSCVRFKLTKSEKYDDMVYGSVLHEVEEIEGDPVIIKMDGLPTYHLANVVDDYFMGISHVIRGVEWLPSTSKHLMIYRALNYEPPRFAHLPLLLNSDGNKLSKRQGDVSVEYFRNKGIEKRALLNFIIQAGSGFENLGTQNIFSLDELCEKFELNLLNTNSCKLPMERLPEFNRNELIRQAFGNENELKNLIEKVTKLVKKCFPDSDLELNYEHVKKVLQWSVHRISYLTDLVDGKMLFLWKKPCYENLNENYYGILKQLRIDLNRINFKKEELSPLLKKFSETNKFSFKKLMPLLRTILSGTKEGPSVAEMMEVLGKHTTLERIEQAELLCNSKVKENVI